MFDSVTPADDIDIAFTPKAFGTADDHLTASSKEAKFQKRDWGFGRRSEIHRDDVGLFLSRQLPLDLFAKLGIIPALFP